MNYLKKIRRYIYTSKLEDNYNNTRADVYCASGGTAEVNNIFWQEAGDRLLELPALPAKRTAKLLHTAKFNIQFSGWIWILQHVFCQLVQKRALPSQNADELFSRLASNGNTDWYKN
jgi:hypothetical protein